MKKNNLRKAILFAFSTFALTLGVGGARKEAAITAKAANITTGKVIYFQPSEEWTWDSAYFSVWFFNSGNSADDKFVDMKREASTSLYSVTTPASATGHYGNVQFTRQNPANPTGWKEDDPDKQVWNKTAVLTFDGTNDVFVMNAGSYSEGSWRKFNEETDILPEIPASTDLYIRPSGTFMDGANRVAAYFYNTDGKNDWVSATEEEGGLYKVVSPTLADGVLPNYVIFASMKSDTTGNNWDNKQDQTADLLPDLTKPVFDHASSSWQVLPTIVTPIATTEGINTNKLRLWLNRNGHFATEAHQYFLRVGENRYIPTGHEKALEYGEHGAYFAYWDIEIATLKGKEVGFTVVNTANEVQKEMPTTTFEEKDNSKLWTILYDEETDVWSIQKGKVVGKVYASFLGKVLEGYLSCLPSVDNGYGAFNLFDENFIERFENGEWNVVGTLGDVTIDDFANVEDYATGARNASVNAYVKYQMLERNYNNSLGGAMQTRVVATNNSLLIASIVIAVLGISLIAYVSYRKKLHA